MKLRGNKIPRFFVHTTIGNAANGLYHKGTGTPRKTQARAPFAAQTDRERRNGGRHGLKSAIRILKREIIPSV